MATGALVAFTALSAVASIVKGIQANSAATDQGIAMMKQAQIAQYESNYAAAQKQREVDKAAARQVMAMSRNGLNTSAGSPLEILYETMTLGQDEVNAIRRKGNAQVDMYRTEANNAFKSGRSSLLSGVTDALTTVGTTYIGGVQAGLWGKAGNATKSSGITWGKAASGAKIGTNSSGNIFAGLSSGLS